MDSQAIAINFGVVGGVWVWILTPLHFGAFIMPTLLLVVATAVRWALELPFTCWADTLLAFVAFDATVIVDSHTFQLFFRNSDLANYLVGIHLVFLLIAVAVWIMLVWRAEKHLVPARDNGRISRVSFLAMGAGVVAVSVLLALHVATYLSGG